MAAQRPQAVADIAGEALDRGNRELVVRPLTRLFHAAEPDERAPPGFVRRHAGAQVLLGLLLDMKADLVVEAFFELPPPPQVSQCAHKAPQLTRVTSRTRLTARDMRRHCASDSSRWRRPRAVSE